MQNRLASGLLASLFLLGVARGEGKAEQLTAVQTLDWTRHLVPLPKKVEFTGAVSVPVGGVKIIAKNGREPLIAQAVKELQATLAATPDVSPVAFRIELHVDANAADLVGLPHLDQAYAIRANAAGDGLVLTGGGVRGAYYAAKTLKQLLAGRVADGRVRVPLVSVTDWPDIEDRGLWGGDSYDHLRFMADRKMNYDEQISHCGVSRDKQVSVTLEGNKQKIVSEGPKYGINGVPVVLHLEQLSGSGLFEAYPELAGKNGRKGSICYSNPLFIDLLARWLVLWGQQPGVTEVDVWMAENLQQQKGCQCEQCAKEDRSVLEARAILAAWRKARETLPALGLRILTSEETEKANPRIFAELPKDVKIWYYHSLFTYNTSKKPMIRPYLVDAIKQGHWVGVCPNVCAIVGTFQPLTGPQFIHYRLNEFVDKGLSGIIGYAVPRIGHTQFNAEATAEWSWNVHGRSPREFAISYAVRQGYPEPEKFADWCDLNGPIGWRIYGSEWPSGEQRDFPGKMAKLLKEGKVPEFGSVLWEVYPVPWGEYHSAAELEQDVVGAARAVELANELGVQEYIQESLVIQGYVNALQALAQLKQRVKNGAVAEADRPAAKRWFKQYVDSLEQSRAALPLWEASLPFESSKLHYANNAVKVLDEMIVGMQATAADLGVKP